LRGADGDAFLSAEPYARALERAHGIAAVRHDRPGGFEISGGAAHAGWKPYRHPQLGDIEIGGWDRFNAFSNPPRPLLERELAKFPRWLIWQALTSPRLELVQRDTLFEDIYDRESFAAFYDVMPGGKELLMQRNESRPRLAILLNWLVLLRPDSTSRLSAHGTVSSNC